MTIPADLSMNATAEAFLEHFRAQQFSQGILFSLSEGSQAQHLLTLEVSSRQRSRLIKQLKAANAVACYAPNCWGFRIPYRKYLIHITLEIEAEHQAVICRSFGRVLLPDQ